LIKSDYFNEYSLQYLAIQLIGPFRFSPSAGLWKSCAALDAWAYYAACLPVAGGSH